MKGPTKSIKGHLILTVVLSQLVLAAGLVFTGVFYLQRRLQAALDADLQARAMSVAALVRYAEDGSHNLVFEKSLVPPPLDLSHPDFYEIRKDTTVLARSPNWPADLTFDNTKPRAYRSLVSSGLPYRALHLNEVPILDREEAPPSSSDTLIVVYAEPTLPFATRSWPPEFTLPWPVSYCWGRPYFLPCWAFVADSFLCNI